MLNGIDISSWQGNIDLSKVPCDFVIIKGTGGVGYVNPYCDSRYQLAKKLGKSLGVYHFAKEKGLEGSAIAEADFFVKNCSNYLKGEAIPILDWEPSSNQGDVTWVLTWLKRVKELTGINPLFYTYTGIVNAYDFSQVYKNNFGLWIANYGSNKTLYSYQTPNPPTSNGFPSTVMYQYNSKTRLTGYSGDLDVNVFYGDKTTWKKYATPYNTSTPTPPSNNALTYDNALTIIAKEVINGRFGNGVENRKNKIYNEVQKRVNEIL